MRLHRLTLSFKGQYQYLEEEFKCDYFLKYLSHIRLCHIISIVFYSAVGFLDAILFPQVKGVLILIRLGVICPLFLLGLAFSYHKNYIRYYQICLGCFIVLTGCGSIAVMVIAPPPLSYSYYASVIGCMVFGYAFIRASFFAAASAGTIIFCVYELVSIFKLTTPRDTLISHTYHIGIVMVVGMMIAYSLEFYARRDFYISYLLERKNMRLIKEIGMRRRIQQQLRRSLREKELYLKEIHHRVKNNLQIISSLLDMTRYRAKDSYAENALAGVRSKLQTMALIHSQLYGSTKFERIYMGPPITELFCNLSILYGNNGRIKSKIVANNVLLPMIQAIPCALILNELISNALKHAFNGVQSGLIEIYMQKTANGKITVNVRDNGVGIPAHIDVQKTDSLGLKLVRILVVEQLKGDFRISIVGGTSIRFEFNPVTEVNKNE